MTSRAGSAVGEAGSKSGGNALWAKLGAKLEAKLGATVTSRSGILFVIPFVMTMIVISGSLGHELLQKMWKRYTRFLLVFGQDCFFSHIADLSY